MAEALPSEEEQAEAGPSETQQEMAELGKIIELRPTQTPPQTEQDFGERHSYDQAEYDRQITDLRDRAQGIKGRLGTNLDIQAAHLENERNQRFGRAAGE